MVIHFLEIRTHATITQNCSENIICFERYMYKVLHVVEEPLCTKFMEHCQERYTMSSVIEKERVFNHYGYVLHFTDYIFQTAN